MLTKAAFIQFIYEKKEVLF